MAAKTIHVHQAEVRKRDPENHPAIIVRTHRRSTHHQEVQILGPSTLVHSVVPDSCGARVWIATKSPVLADGVLIP